MFVHAYSLSWEWKRRQRQKFQDKLPLDLLAYANPKGINLRQGHSLPATAGSLPVSGVTKKTGTGDWRDVRTLAAHYTAPLRVTVREKTQATRSFFLQEAWKARILHLAVHGWYQKPSPMDTALALGPDVRRGRLTAWDILDMKLNTEIGVVAACDVAQGKSMPGEGLMGIAWALGLAGCSTTIVSQRKVDIESTDALMTEFHRLVSLTLKGQAHYTKAEMFQMAVKRVRENRAKHWSPRYFWAGFILIGDGGRLRPLSHNAFRPALPRLLKRATYRYINRPRGEMEIHLVGEKGNFRQAIPAREGNQVYFKIFMENTGRSVGKKPTVRLNLPANFRYVPHSGYALIKRKNTNFLGKIEDRLMGITKNTLVWTFQDMEPTPSAAFYLMFRCEILKRTNSQSLATKRQGRSTASQISYEIHHPVRFAAECAFEAAKTKTNRVTVTIIRTPSSKKAIEIRQEIGNLTLYKRNQESKYYHSQPAPAQVGDTLVIKLEIMNTGNVLLKKVRVRCPLPPWLKLEGGLHVSRKGTLPQTLHGSEQLHKGIPLSNLRAEGADICIVWFNVKVLKGEEGQLLLGEVRSEVAEEDSGATLTDQDRGRVLVGTSPALYLVLLIKTPRDNEFTVQSERWLKPGDVVSYRIFIANATQSMMPSPLVAMMMPPHLRYKQGSLTIDGARMSPAIEKGFLSSGMTMTDMPPGYGQELSCQLVVTRCPVLEGYSFPYLINLQVPNFTDVIVSAVDVRQAFH